MTMLRYSGGRHTSGYFILDDPNNPRPIERETISCCHCQLIKAVEVGTRPDDWGFCFKCNAPYCNKHVCSSRCVPFEQWVEGVERRSRLFSHLDRERELERQRKG